MEFDEKKETMMSATVVDDGQQLQRRFDARMQQANELSARARRLGVDPMPVKVYTPTRIKDGRWGFKDAMVWQSYAGCYMVGYDADDESTIRIYRKKQANKLAGGEENPTYEVFVTTVWQDSEIDRVQASLLCIGA